MNTKTRALVALAGSAVVALMAFPAFASDECDGPCGPPGPSGPPPLPNLPGAAASTSGSYSVSLGTIGNSELRQGYYQDGQTTYFGGGPFHPVGGDGHLTVGQTNNTVTLTPVISPLASVTVATVATTAQDPVFTGFDLVARGSLSLGYLVDLHANNQAAADALAGLLSTSGAVAHINGLYSLQATGSSWGSVSASTGIQGLAPGLDQVFAVACSPISYFGSPGACHDGSYSLALNFVSGTAFADGNPLDFYGTIGLSATSNSGPPNLGWAPGTITASIDPTITFSSGINLNNYSLKVGGFDSPLGSGGGTGGVPEPATWALMLMGFGGLGAVLRRRRQAALAACRRRLNIARQQPRPRKSAGAFGQAWRQVSTGIHHSTQAPGVSGWKWSG
jgi:hypothetical protein